MTVPPVEQDSRGILDPAEFVRRVQLHRYPPPPELAGLVAWFWTVAWDLPDGFVHTSQVLTHPCANLSVAHGEPDDAGRPGPVEAELTGVERGLSRRRLAGNGWCVAAMTTPGGLGALVPSAAAVTDRVVALGPALGLDAAALVASCLAAPSEPARVEVLSGALAAALSRADPDRVAAAREVASAAAMAEHDRTLLRLDQLAAACGIGARTLQRMFHHHAGVSPTWVIRRYRLIDAAERVRSGETVVWAEVAAELGYSDQAHLVRDFRAALGTTPSVYAEAQRPF